MQETVESKQAQAPIEPERLVGFGLFMEMLNGIGVMLGLALLWLLEKIRNSFFRVLDRMNVKARARRGSAFPPGRPRRTQQAS